jgi:hypothetical protein
VAKLTDQLLIILNPLTMLHYKHGKSIKGKGEVST